MKRKIIVIDEEKCNGCAQCVDACAEGALQIIDGKAKLVRDSFCDGLGACIGDCPEDALHIVERDADDFDEEAALAHVAKLKAAAPPADGPLAARFGGCPGSAMREFAPENGDKAAPAAPADAGSLQSMLGHWPVQIRLIPPGAPFLQGADILICADCVPFALPGFHQRYLNGKAVLVGCPKLDDTDEIKERLTAVFGAAQPASITVLKMEVPCCTGISVAAMEARDEAAPGVPVEMHTIGVRGEVQQVEKIEPNQPWRMFA